MTCAYDGTDYFGWQRTAMGPSVEEALSNVLEQILQHPISLQAASRTDRGVHAHGQVVNCLTHSLRPLSLLHKSLNALLPSSIVVLSVEEASLSFHPTLHALGKEYLYRLNTAPIQLPFTRWTHWHVPHSLDWTRARHAAASLVGKHDFSAFCNRHEGRTYAHKRRHLWWCRIEQTALSEITLFLAGNSFLYKMARNLVGTLVDIATGRLQGNVEELLRTGQRASAGFCAPAHGLSLNRVFYKLPHEL